MKYGPIIAQAEKLVKEEYRMDFLWYVTMGEATPEFLAYVASDKAAQEAIDLVFKAYAPAFEDLAARLQDDTQKKDR